ncbi:hypothetical protein C1A40_14480 [Tamlana carrageenivorans]|uniref:Uncharacterized protein n=1 Tax=Pseudotamlana carrageenivorans TaxID=2069432 RepID=A0A2I7SL16_9FLAO|nr:hypothetical protein C1A40_14480 [Tamlana carrageenivorans]
MVVSTNIEKLTQACKTEIITMTKKVIGAVFLIIAFLLTICIVHRLAINPIAWSKFKEFITGKAGLNWSILIIAFYSLILVPIFLMFKYGLKLTKLFK